jgi:hypothetical protein
MKKSRSSLLRVALCLILTLALFPAGALAEGEVEEHTITVPQVENVTIEIKNNENAVTLDDNNKFTSKTGDMVSYYFTIAPGYKLKEFYIQQENGLIEGVFTTYDSNEEKIYAEVETNFNYTLLVETEVITGLPTPYYAILNSEVGGDESETKAAIRRELALQGVMVSDEDITIGAGTAPATASGATYKEVRVTITDQDDLAIAHFYIVDNAKTLLIMTEPTDGAKELTVYKGSTNFGSVNITIPAITSGKIYAFGPYSAFAMDMSRALGLELPVSAEDDGAYKVTGAFYNMQWHVINQGTSPETRINWYPANIVTADAMYIEAVATKDEVTQMAGAWAIDTSPRINSVDDGTLNYRLEIFFGNDTVTISPPATGNVTGVAVRTESDSPGYTFEDVPEDESGLADAVKVTFHSDYYDNITVPLTLTVGTDELTNVKNVKANVTIHRVGVEIQEHSIEHTDGSISQIWHGTQNGSQVDLSEYGFRLTATYYIPDGEEAPYGLFVTRIYSGGRVETETIPDSMDEVCVHGEAASAVDYIVYSGANAASAPVSVSVLVLKNEPDENTFGGVDFGSGIGVTRTK